jgi:Family of unknown function (DUF6098)
VGYERGEIGTLDELTDLVASRPGLHVRWSRGPDDDADETSRDHASGLDLPGLAANPLDPPGWWTLPLGDWVARQITTYAHLGEDAPDHVAWVLTGRVVDRGPDNEPLVAEVRPVAPLSRAVLDEAEARSPSSRRPQDDDRAWQG